MKNSFTFLIISIILIFLSSTTIISQTFDGEWRCAYATTDNSANGTGIQTITVGVLAENEFVAMVSQSAPPWLDGDACYLVGYRNADSTHGRLGSYAYNTKFNQIWINGFDQVYMEHALDLATHNGLIFVPNNDVDHNILVFELKDDSIYTYPNRLVTNLDPFNPDTLWAIDIDGSGKVYVTTKGSETKPSKIIIFGGPDEDAAWASGGNGTPLQTIVLPDNGVARGVTVNSDGNVIYVSNYTNGKIYAYVGNATDGYTLSPSFNFEKFDQADSVLTAAPWGLQFMDDNNILFAAMDASFTTSGYAYGRIYAINPNTGEILDTIDVAKWNYDITGAYNNRPGQIGIASGYTSTYNVDVDEAKNLYSQSYYGWTVEKWVFDGTLPMIELTITDVEKIDSNIPNSFEVSQNYPNPFNPSTTIEFSINKTAPITLSVYNIKGELITNLVNGAEFAPGVYKITFDASRLASGTYIYSINDGENIISKKMTLLK